MVKQLNSLHKDYYEEYSKEIVGEKELIEILELIFHSKFVINKNPLSFNTIINSQSGSGKDFILSRVIKELDDKHDYEEFTKISPRALDYLHANEPGFTWNNKFLILHDIEEETINSSTMKLFMSEGSKTAIVDNKGVAVVRKIDGRPTIIMTTAFSEPNHEILRRVNLVNLDESKDQTKKIIEHYAQSEESDDIQDIKIDYKYYKIENKPNCYVKIPYARLLAELVLRCNSEEHIHMRTFFPKLLDFIRAQTMRTKSIQEITGKPIIYSEYEDYEEIRHLFNNRFSYTVGFRPLSLNRRKFFELIKKHFGDGGWFTVKDVESVSSMTYEGVRKQIKNLYEDDFLDSRLDRENFKPVIEYKLKDSHNIKLPSILAEIDKITDCEIKRKEFDDTMHEIGIEEEILE